MTDPIPPQATSAERKEALDRELREGERRTGSGHQRLTFLGPLTLALMTIYLGAWAFLQLRWFGPVVSIILIWLSLCQLIWLSRPHIKFNALVRDLFKFSPGKLRESAYAESASATTDVTLKKLGSEVDFYRWGVYKREIMYIRAAVLLVVSFMPIGWSVWNRLNG